MAFRPDFPSYIEMLRQANIGEGAAMAHAKALNTFIIGSMAAKEDFQAMVNHLEGEVNIARDSLRAEMQTMKTEIMHKIDVQFFRLGGLMAVGIGVLEFLDRIWK